VSRGIDEESQDIASAVVAYWIKLVTSHPCPLGVDLCIKNAFFADVASGMEAYANPAAKPAAPETTAAVTTRDHRNELQILPAI
jgi:hypothetical protein